MIRGRGRVDYSAIYNVYTREVEIRIRMYDWDGALNEIPQYAQIEIGDGRIVLMPTGTTPRPSVIAPPPPPPPTPEPEPKKEEATEKTRWSQLEVD